MLRLALLFLIISIIAGLFGFTGISAAAAGIAKVLFFIFVVIFVVLLAAGLLAGSAIFLSGYRVRLVPGTRRRLGARACKSSE
jgi:uncharacterized membrane protein YtjA (UPF0391 family)